MLLSGGISTEMADIVDDLLDEIGTFPEDKANDHLFEEVEKDLEIWKGRKS